MTVVFLGPLRDVAGADSIQLPAPLDWPGLLAGVPAEVAAHLQSERVSVACAGHVLRDKAVLDAAEGHEVALLPPVSGG